MSDGRSQQLPAERAAGGGGPRNQQSRKLSEQQQRIQGWGLRLSVIPKGVVVGDEKLKLMKRDVNMVDINTVYSETVAIHRHT